MSLSLIIFLEDMRKNTEYREIFLMTYVAFTTSENILRVLVRKFHEVEASSSESRARMCYK
jgi:hypothetical protein